MLEAESLLQIAQVGFQNPLCFFVIPNNELARVMYPLGAVFSHPQKNPRLPGPLSTNLHHSAHV